MNWWQTFADSFETKGAQILLLWITDIIVITVLVLLWRRFDATLQTTIVGILSAVNGAFLGALGARPPSGGADTLHVGFTSKK